MDRTTTVDNILKKLLKKDPSGSKTVPLDDVRRLVEDLRLHQIELEMQNEELRQAQQKIEEGRQKLSDLYDFAPIGYVTLEDGVITEANLTAAGIFGKDRTKLINKPFTDYVDTHHKARFIRHVEGVVENRCKAFAEILLIRGTTPFWAQLESVFVPSGDGKPRAVRTAIIDIQSRRDTEEALASSEEKYRALVESVNSVIVGLDSEGRVTFLNDYGHDLFGYTAEELWSKGILGTIVPREYIRPEDLRSYIAYIAEHPGKYREREMENLRRGGDKVWMSWTIRTLHDNEGRFEGLLCVGNDITERKKLEGQLRQAQKMEAIGTLAGGIAHDFNNILAAVIGFAEMVEEDLASDSKSTLRIQRVLKAAYRGRDLVKQILAFSRKVDPTRSPLSLSPILEETVHLLRASLPSTIDIKLSMEAATDTILASPTEFQQIIMNLAMNASFAMGEKGGTLGIGITNVVFEPDFTVLDDAMSGEYIQITVEDTGSGMTPDIMQRIFEPFFTTKEAGRGTGMGLAVVHGIVKSLNGNILAESKPNKGSTFRVYLPVARTGEKPETVKRQVIPRGSENILFVDDEELIMEWGKDALERLGYTVTSLDDSTEALNLFSSDPYRFDLAIVDQTMPKLTGMSLAGKILALRPNIPIILCTGHSDSLSREKAKEAGIKEFLMKPLGRQELASAVRRVLDGEDKE